MPRRVHVQKVPNGQYLVTIPKALAEAIGLRKGEEVQWSLKGDDLVLRRMGKGK